MRMPKYLSPSSIDLWNRDKVEFYFRYLADDRPERMAQTKPMAVGSGFDAMVKSYLMTRLLGGIKINGQEMDERGLFDLQVDAPLRDWAWAESRAAMELYRASGALGDLMLELDSCSDVSFELAVEGRVDHSSVKDGIPLLGRPDLYYYDDAGRLRILDWKVNGWESARATSPVAGYVMCRTLKGGSWKRVPHHAAVVMQGINIAAGLETLNIAWARQLCIYAWVIDRNGRDFIVGIDQLVGKNRVSSLRNRIGSIWQAELLEEIATIWTRIQMGEIFDEDNKERIEMLDAYASGYRADTSEHRDWLEGVIRCGH